MEEISLKYIADRVVVQADNKDDYIGLENVESGTGNLSGFLESGRIPAGLVGRHFHRSQSL